jgi:hypothetical protein
LSARVVGDGDDCDVLGSPVTRLHLIHTATIVLGRRDPNPALWMSVGH